MATRISLVAFAAVFFGFTASAAAKDGSATAIQLSAKPPAIEYLVAKPISVKKMFLDETPDILPVFPRQSQFPQPVVIKNYYLTAQSKKEVLPFWQGPRPLRLRNRFIR